jgi:hypothetical protein
MKGKAGRFQDRLKVTFGLAEDLLGVAHKGCQFSFYALGSLQFVQLRANRRDLAGADIFHTLLAVAAKSELPISTTTTSFRAQKALLSQYSQIVVAQAQASEYRKILESEILIRTNMWQ